MLVEDESSVRVLVKRMLERAGYRVVHAKHGREALSVCEKHEGPIHLVLTDVIMPEIGGRELVERILNENTDIKILFMSGYSDEAKLRLDELPGKVSFLPKPFSYDELIMKVRVVLDEMPFVAVAQGG